MSECTHNCSTCSSGCGDSEFHRDEELMEKLYPGAKVKKVIAVVSGKGGVGKSMVTSLLAAETQRRGFRTAVMDADLTGPSIPKSFGVDRRAVASDSFMYPVTTESGIQLMSMNLLLEDSKEPVLWRGPVIAGVVAQFWSEVMWVDVDYMFIDLPPGTGDVPLTVLQGLPVDGIVIVTSPQDLVGMIVEKAVVMAKMMKVPVLTLVENMSYYVCPKCGDIHEVFGESHVKETAERFDINSFIRLPINPDAARLVDCGRVEDIDCDYVSAMADLVLNNPRLEK
ncbi:MAG: Mrp/NBP35 family ATP-binding protein [Oscillospiraceae bacterium]|nr:Mrp/NBP35 family ATP-binding protein [Oscillospiraceae bacterium]